jgi:hypothetical protein
VPMSSMVSANPTRASQPFGSGDETWRDLPAAPLVVRLSGLPTSTIQPFRSAILDQLCKELVALTDEVAEARRELVATIETNLTRFDGRARRLLLAIKRSCFNNRPLCHLLGDPEWPRAIEAGGDQLSKLLSLEKRLTARNLELEATYESELQRERRDLLRLTSDNRFLRGIALARPGLVEKIRSKTARNGHNPSGSRPAKWELSLVRFATRASTKLSANSTLTTYALGALATSESLPNLRIFHEPLKERSLVRANRPELELLEALLLLHPAIRGACPISWNPAARPTTDKTWTVIRQARWKRTAPSSALELQPASKLTIKGRHDFLDALRQYLGTSRFRYEDLLTCPQVATLGNSFAASGEPIGSHLESLIDMGLLILSPPWPTGSPSLERAILAHLSNLDQTTDLEELTRALEAFVRLENSYHRSEHPDRAAQSLHDQLNGVLRLAAASCSSLLTASLSPHFFEDVLTFTTSRPQAPHVLELTSVAQQNLRRTTMNLGHFCSLFNFNLDFHFVVRSWWATELPNCNTLTFLDFAHKFAPRWEQFLSFLPGAYESALSTFRPSEDPYLAKLQDLRATVLRSTEEAIEAKDGQFHLSNRAFQRILDSIPTTKAPHLLPSAFIQPVNSMATRWVLNRLTDGTGRYITRLTPSLPPAYQESMIAKLRTTSHLTVCGERGEFLDVNYPRHNLASAYCAQTNWCLAPRGEPHREGPTRSVTLQDLHLHFDSDSSQFSVRTRNGERLVPVHLCSLADNCLPSLVRLLLAFGPGETRAVLPFPKRSTSAQCQITERLWYGDLAIHRKRWTLPARPLRDALRARSPQAFALHLRRLTDSLGLPQGFFIRTATSRASSKPQYFSPTSPLLAHLLVDLLADERQDWFIFEEALPDLLSADSFPDSMDTSLELLIDTQAVRSAVL